MVKKPSEPAPGECCGSGCARCVWDIYYDKLDQYEAWRAERKRQVPGVMGTGVERKVMDIEDLRGGGDDDDDDEDGLGEGDEITVGNAVVSPVGSVVVKYEMSSLSHDGGSLVDHVLDSVLGTDIDLDYAVGVRGYLYGENGQRNSLDSNEVRRFGGVDAEGDEDEEERRARSATMVGGPVSNNNGVYGVSSDAAAQRHRDLFGAELRPDAASNVVDAFLIQLLKRRAMDRSLDEKTKEVLASLDAGAGFVAQRQRQELLTKAKQRLRRLIHSTDQLDTPSAAPSIDISLLPPRAVDFVLSSTTSARSPNVGVPWDASNPHHAALIGAFDAARSGHTSEADMKQLVSDARQLYLSGGWQRVKSVELLASSHSPYTKGTHLATDAEATPLCILRLNIQSDRDDKRRAGPIAAPGDVVDIFAENTDDDVNWLCKRLAIQPARRLSLTPSPFGPDGGFPRWLPSPFNHRYHYGVTVHEGGRTHLYGVESNLDQFESAAAEMIASVSSPATDAEERRRRALEKESAILKEALLDSVSSTEDQEHSGKGVAQSAEEEEGSGGMGDRFAATSRCLPQLTVKYLFQRYVDLHSSAYLRPPLFTMLMGCLREPMGFGEGSVIALLEAANGHHTTPSIQAALSATSANFKDVDLISDVDFFLQRAALQLITNVHPSQQTAKPYSGGLEFLLPQPNIGGPPSAFATHKDSHLTLTRIVTASSPSIREVLTTFSCCKPNLPRLLEVMTPLRPRRFSVASVNPAPLTDSVDLIVRQIVRSRDVGGPPSQEPGPHPAGLIGPLQTSVFQEMGVLQFYEAVTALHRNALAPAHTVDVSTGIPAINSAPPAPFCGFITQRLVEMALAQGAAAAATSVGVKRPRESPMWARHVPVRHLPQVYPPAPEGSPSEVKIRDLVIRSKLPVMPLFPVPCPNGSGICTSQPHHPVFVIAGGSGYAPFRGWVHQRLMVQRQLLRASPTTAVGATTVLLGMRRCAEAVMLAREMEPWAEVDSETQLPLHVNAYLSRTPEDGSSTPRYSQMPSFLNLLGGMRMTLGSKESTVFMDPTVAEELAAAIIEDPLVAVAGPPIACDNERVTPPVIRSVADPSTKCAVSGGVIVACGPAPFLASVRDALISAVGSSSRLFPVEDRGDRSVAEQLIAKAELDRRVVFDNWKI